MTRMPYRLAMTLILLSHFPLYARETFNIHALEMSDPGQGTADLSVFSTSDGQPPGLYLVTVYINGELQAGEQNIRFITDTQGRLQPQLTPALLKQWGVNLDTVPLLRSQGDNTCIDSLEHFIPMASSEFVFNQLRLNISLPQAVMGPITKDAIKTSDWDEGTSAALLNYSLSTGHGWNSTDNNRYYANMQSGINVGAFRFRNYSTWNYDDNSGGNWQTISSYLQRDVVFLKSQLILGDRYSSADIFESIPFRGVQLASDDNMLPDSLRGFSPIIRGVARSSAEVTVKQNGYIILRTYVAPGAFTLNDLYPTSSGGDLTVLVREADGSEHTFIQPFSALPIMQREGRLKYALTAGKYRNQGDSPVFAQLTSMYGLPHGTTLYGGVQYADAYQAQVLGVGTGLGQLGALSADITLAQAPKSAGSSYRLLYSKKFPMTDTSITLAGYRYSTSGFYTFGDVVDNLENGQSVNRRQRLQLDISQPLGDVGSLFFSAYQQNYWDKKGCERTLSGGWSSRFSGITYNILYSQNQTRDGMSAQEQRLAVNFQIPLSRFFPDSWTNFSMSSTKNGDSRWQAGVSGTALSDHSLRYNVQQSYLRGGSTESNLSAGYLGRYAEISAGYNNSGNKQLFNIDLKGGVVLHPYGLTLSQPLAEQIAIVRTPGVSGLKIQNYPGVMTDVWGNAIIPYVSPYRKNSIALNVEELDEDVDIGAPVKTVIPTQGAVVVASYNMNIGFRVLMTLSYQGKPVPFGAMAVSSSAKSGIVGDEGVLYLSGVQPKESLTVSWSKTQKCTVSFNIPQRHYGQSLIHLKGTCQ